MRRGWGSRAENGGPINQTKYLKKGVKSYVITINRLSAMGTKNSPFVFGKIQHILDLGKTCFSGVIGTKA